ncbi:MAG: ABC transporter permease subunit [Eubacteriales bacterium]|nr:ABC transporter permease subunit [Eubacteriales bacterium]
MQSVLTTENLLYMMGGMKLTLEIAFCASIISILLGTVLALAKAYCHGPAGILNVLASAYVEIFRCTPQLLWILMFRFFVKGGGFNLGVVSLSVVSAPYICEIVRGGLNNISKGQFEAGFAQGFRFGTILRLIVLPQVFRAVLPSMMSQIVSIIKSTSLLASINIFEYLFTCNTIMVGAGSLSGIFTVYVMEAAGYFLVCYLLVLLVHLACRKLKFA